MTETDSAVTMCEALVPSPPDLGNPPGAQLACFLRPHPDSEWHYDSRGLGVAFRVVGDTLQAHLGISPEEAAAREEQPARLALRDGELDVDAMRVQAPVVRQALLDALRHSATLVRQSRGTVVVQEDTYDLVRRLTAAEEVCRQWAQAFTEAAKEAASLIEEEAMTVAGSEQDGVLTSSLFVPDGGGQRIAVRADWKSGESTWDVASLIGWLAEDTVAAEGRGGHEQVYPDANERAFTEAEVIQLAREAMDRLLTLGKFTPYAKQVEVLRKKLAEQQRDADAAVIRQVRTVGPRQYQGVKITREEA